MARVFEARPREELELTHTHVAEIRAEELCFLQAEAAVEYDAC